MPRRLLLSGQKHRIEVYVAENGRSPVLDYLGSLAQAERERAMALIDYTAQHGPPRNKEKGRKLEGEHFFELKSSAQRILWRWGPRGGIILMHGFTKESQKTPKREIRVGRERFHILESELEK